jgi:hypothetical protein
MTILKMMMMTKMITMTMTERILIFDYGTYDDHDDDDTKDHNEDNEHRDNNYDNNQHKMSYFEEEELEIILPYRPTSLHSGVKLVNRTAQPILLAKFL